MQTSSPSYKKILDAATIFQELVDELMFVGGTVTSLLITDPAAGTPRVTEDVDVVVEIASFTEGAQFEEKLRKKGLVNDMTSSFSGRFLAGEMKIDLVQIGSASHDSVNEWYRPAFGEKRALKLTNGRQIFHISAPYFLATKLVAFRNRGEGDFMGSQDVADIVQVLDGRPELIDEIGGAPRLVREFLRQQFSEMITNTRFLEAIPGHLEPDQASQDRAPSVLECCRQISVTI